MIGGSNTIIPTAVMMPFGPAVQIYLFGRPYDWSLKTNPIIADSIARFAFERDITRILAPRPNFSALVCRKDDLTKPIVCSVGRCETVYIDRGCDVDGVDDVFQGEAFYMTSGDCPTLVIYDPETDKLACAHAGRDCLIDRAKLRGRPGRWRESVVDALLDSFSKKNRSRLKAFTVSSIGGENFPHETQAGSLLVTAEQAVDNLLMIEAVSARYKSGACVVGNTWQSGCLSLKNIIRSQLFLAGLQLDNIGHDTIDTFADMSRGEHLWWSNRRGDGEKRNGILVIHRG